MKTIQFVAGVILAIIVVTAITTYARSNSPQSVGYVQPEQTYSTQYRDCQEADGQYVKDLLNLQVDKILAGCVN